MSAIELFVVNTCECCGRNYGGIPTYRSGLLQCPACSSGRHDHPRRGDDD